MSSVSHAQIGVENAPEMARDVLALDPQLGDARTPENHSEEARGALNTITTGAARFLGQAERGIGFAFASLFGSDLSIHVLNPLEVKVGETITIDDPRGGAFLVKELALVTVDNAGSQGSYVEYLLQRPDGGDPEFMKLRFADPSREAPAFGLLLGLSQRTSYSMDLEDRIDEPTNVYVDDDGSTFARIGEDCDGYRASSYELTDQSGDMRATISEVQHRSLRAWSFHRVAHLSGPISDPQNGREFLFVECDGSYMDRWIGSRVAIDKVSKDAVG